MAKKLAGTDLAKSLAQMIVADAKEKYGIGSAATEETTCGSDVTDWLSTGSKTLDWVCGKGLPMGRYIELFGRESTGKSTIGYLIMSQIQKRGGLVILLDTEGSYDSNRAKEIGLKTDEIVFAQLDSMEDCFDFIYSSLEKIRDEDKNIPVGIMWDSVAGTPTKTEIEGEFGQAAFAPAARIISSSFRKMKKLDKQNTLMVFINQVRQKMNPMGIPTWVTYGGEALKYYAATRIQLTFKEQVKAMVGGKEQAIGVQVKVETKKNKVAPPFRQCELVIDFAKGIDTLSTDLLTAVNRKVIDRNGAFYTIGENKWRGYDAMETYYREHPDELQKILEGMIW